MVLRRICGGTSATKVLAWKANDAGGRLHWHPGPADEERDRGGEIL